MGLLVSLVILKNGKNQFHTIKALRMGALLESVILRPKIRWLPTSDKQDGSWATHFLLNGNFEITKKLSSTK